MKFNLFAIPQLFKDSTLVHCKLERTRYEIIVILLMATLQPVLKKDFPSFFSQRLKQKRIPAGLNVARTKEFLTEVNSER
jgi:hypothetical protein